MKKPKILYGICGIGNGHTNRQLPIIEHFARTSDVTLFAYDASFDFFTKHFQTTPSVHIERIAVPFYVGTPQGLDFSATLHHPDNQKVDFLRTNWTALDATSRRIGKPDLVITDYEPTVAQYAYAYNAPLVTIDQQSKYLCGDFPKKLAGFTFEDEIMRLHMFFPKAAARIACSFFRAPQKPGSDAVNIVPPIIKNSVITMKRKPLQRGNSLLVYISSAREFVQNLEDLTKIFRVQKNTEIHLFISREEMRVFKNHNASNLFVYPHGDARFNEIMKTCTGIVSTAGHSLLSEAMFLGIPVYAIPVSPYEQHMNALVINENNFGISYPKLTEKKLAYFIKNIPLFRESIKKDSKVLVRGAGQTNIIKFLEKKFLTS